MQFSRCNHKTCLARCDANKGGRPTNRRLKVLDPTLDLETPNRASGIRHSLPHGIVVGDLPVELSAKDPLPPVIDAGLSTGTWSRLRSGTMLVVEAIEAWFGSVRWVQAGPGLGRAKRSFRRSLGCSCPRPHRLESRSLVRSRMWPGSGA